MHTAHLPDMSESSGSEPQIAEWTDGRPVLKQDSLARRMHACRSDVSLTHQAAHRSWATGGGFGEFASNAKC